MSRLSYCLNFYCRASKANRAGESPVELSIIINGKRCFIQLPIRCKASEFNKLLVARKNNPVKEYCEETKSKLGEIQLDMLKNNIPFTADNLREYYRNGGIPEKTYTITKLFDEYLTMIKPRVGVDMCQASYNRYLKVKEYMLDYLKKDVLLNDITPATIQGFLIYLKSKYEESTVAGMMTKLKTIIRYALDNGKISSNPSINIKYGKGKKPIEYLTEPEIQLLKKKVIDIERLEKVRDLALFQINSGLSYSDIMLLTKEDFHYTEDGTCYISKKRKKTKVEYTAVVLPDGVEVLKKYDYQLPQISNQKLNSYLKEIQDICKISKNLHSHLFRKTYGTLLLNKGVRLEVVSRCLGHSSTQITQSVYSKLLQESIIKEVQAVF